MISSDTPVNPAGFFCSPGLKRNGIRIRGQIEWKTGRVMKDVTGALLKVSSCNPTSYLAEKSIVKSSVKNIHPPFSPVEGWRVSPWNKNWNS